ncbi:MAG: helix-turn-helix transcriptional regulator [Acidobacteria bacterium]|nr:helix-turn-helix transcriptional regulator [Acidobacteriota bacterium]
MYRSDKIRGKQAELGWSVGQLARRAEVNPNTVSAIRNGRSVTTVSLEKVINALGLQPAEVFEPKPEVQSAAA